MMKYAHRHSHICCAELPRRYQSEFKDAARSVKEYVRVQSAIFPLYSRHCRLQFIKSALFGNIAVFVPFLFPINRTGLLVLSAVFRMSILNELKLNNFTTVSFHRLRRSALWERGISSIIRHESRSHREKWLLKRDKTCRGPGRRLWRRRCFASHARSLAAMRASDTFPSIYG